MRESYYNYYVPQGNIVLLYNSLSKGYLALKKTVFDSVFIEEKMDIDKLKNNYLYVYDSLLENGFLIEDSVNEQLLVENVFYNNRFSTSVYELIINTTLDCNLKCWYCYEGHITSSKMKNDIVVRILKNIENKYKTEPFKVFYLKFFGGEPILQPKVIFKIIEEVGKLAQEYGFNLQIHFTTNGTIIPERLLKMSNSCKMSFQITIDGNKEQHNTVRIKKIESTHIGTYDRILRNIKRIISYPNCRVTVRVNFSEKTFDKLKDLIVDLDTFDRKKINISLHKVWQVHSNLINQEKLLDFICYANSKSFVVNYIGLVNNAGVTCYADKYNQAVINYDGTVYKCTARDFNKTNQEGVLDENGKIIWNTEKVMNRMSVKISKQCKCCKLLPACPGVCTQKRMEDKNNFICALDKRFSVEDYIIQNFNNQMILAKLAKVS